MEQPAVEGRELPQVTHMHQWKSSLVVSSQHTSRQLTRKYKDRRYPVRRHKRF
ncbi:hypothetical protein DPMN_012778, partial [Dreissena polymorpha]